MARHISLVDMHLRSDKSSNIPSLISEDVLLTPLAQVPLYNLPAHYLIHIYGKRVIKLLLLLMLWD